MTRRQLLKLGAATAVVPSLPLPAPAAPIALITREIDLEEGTVVFKYIRGQSKKWEIKSWEMK